MAKLAKIHIAMIMVNWKVAGGDELLDVGFARPSVVAPLSMLGKVAVGW
jgi:hypothetical protein